MAGDRFFRIGTGHSFFRALPHARARQQLDRLLAGFVRADADDVG